MSRVVTYCNDFPGSCFCQLALDSDERILISVASGEGIAVIALDESGLEPLGTVWMAAGVPSGGEALDRIRDRLLRCASTREVPKAMSELTSATSSGSKTSVFAPTVRAMSVTAWTIGSGALAWNLWGPVAGIIAGIIMLAMCQVGNSGTDA